MATLREERPHARSLLGRVAHVLGNALLALAVVGFTAFAIGPHVFGYRTLTMLSGSMRPLIPVGSVAVVTREPVAAVAPGQIITFATPTPDHHVVTHRVVGVVRLRDGHVAVRTRGDANPTADPWLAELSGDPVWRYRGTIPLVGRAIHDLAILRTRVLAVTLTVVVAGWVLIAVWRRPRPPARQSRTLPQGPADART